MRKSDYDLNLHLLVISSRKRKEKLVSRFRRECEFVSLMLIMVMPPFGRWAPLVIYLSNIMEEEGWVFVGCLVFSYLGLSM